ncbi:IS1634 family transposase [Microbispora hainanensis]|uniref:IS1634 family transposase n=2 Tax=Microbispora hainanensis TaxID=568844 RepID=A0A544XME2_9ACTN|nr:IS1634 family transposase [Microbispora hainanensis]
MHDAGMYLRKTQRRNRDGSVVRYLQLANNHRINGTTQAEVLVNLGREDNLDVDALRRLVASINRYLGDEDDASAPLGAEAGPLSVDSARPFGAIWLLDGLWRMLEIDKALAGVLGPRRFRTDVERVIFALVANRAIAPSSKLAAADWVTHTVAVPGLATMDKDQAMRAMDLLVSADAQGEVSRAVFFSAANLLNLEVDLIFFDTTSTYFERDGEAEADQDGGGVLRRFGHSKDHRRDLPQIVIGLAVTREGIPVRVWVWPGNTSDMTVIEQVKDDLRDWRLGRVVTVTDSGFSSRENMAYLQRAGGHYICGVKMREGSEQAAQALSRQGRYQQVRDNLRVKEVKLTSDPGRRWIICHNPVEAERDAARREAQLEAIRQELERIAAARAADVNKAQAKAARQGNKRISAKPGDAVHRKAECALRDHPSLGRWLKQHPSTGRLSIDAVKVKAEANLDGKYLIATSDPDLTPEDVALGYKNLLEAEAAFRTMKTTLDLRPVYHRLDERITAHVLLCWLALLLIRVAERRTGQTWRTINRELSRVHQVTLAGPAGRLTQTTKLTPAQAQLFKDCGIAPPPKMTGLQPAE